MGDGRVSRRKNACIELRAAAGSGHKAHSDRCALIRTSDARGHVSRSASSGEGDNLLEGPERMSRDSWLFVGAPTRQLCAPGRSARRLCGAKSGSCARAQGDVRHESRRSPVPKWFGPAASATTVAGTRRGRWRSLRRVVRRLGTAGPSARPVRPIGRPACYRPR